jgi:hypothetical protein
MEGEEVLVAGEDEVGVTGECQGEQPVVSWVSAGGNRRDSGDVDIDAAEPFQELAPVGWSVASLAAQIKS